jgi:hypothetical protein
MSTKESDANVFVASGHVDSGSIAALLRAHGTQVVVGHPTFHNEETIGALVERGLTRAAEPGTRRTTVMVCDGTWRADAPDMNVLDAAEKAARGAFSSLADTSNLQFIAVTCDGYEGDRTPGKGSALKLVFAEAAAADVETVVLADGDLRNDMGSWRDVYEKLHAYHRVNYPGQPYFVTARYARHFVDASLTRFIVGPLTTLLGTYVPGGISGDIAVSAEVLQLEAGADWTVARRKYGTDISTTLDNIAAGTKIYEVYLGAKLHDVTDEAKLSVMPGEVIGAALERLKFWEANGGLVSSALQEDSKLNRVESWGSERTGISFIDPGETEVFNLDSRLNSMIVKYDEFEPVLTKILSPAELLGLGTRVALLRNAERIDSAAIPVIGVGLNEWCGYLYSGVAYALKHDDIEPAKLALSYLYAAACLDYVCQRFQDLGMTTFGAVRKVEDRLAVPADMAEEFYEHRVDGVAQKLALSFHAGRGQLRTLLEDTEDNGS